MGMTYILARGFLVHVVFLMSIFDIYFKSPIVPGITSSPNPVPGPAKRLVFIVADGLRADSFLSNDMKSTPFLRSKIHHDGSWGVSHTRVPTESRPGVVALAAGIYEDPSAVFKGWKENPVEFDSLFNRSHHTWAWGSPDIVHMFKKDHVETMAYSPDDEDFSGKDSSWKLDKWVFDNVKMFFEKAKDDHKLNGLLLKEKNVFFLHLLGLDTAGHTIKPHSAHYQVNLQIVDQGVKDMEELFEKKFGDGQTVYVFTADHGMTNWGSHGAGSRDETEVPLLAWGAGVKRARPSDPSDPVSPPHWSLSNLKRTDVKQADIVVLLSSLIGSSIPVNSLGHLPRTFLDLPDESIAKLSFLNAEQLLAQAERKRELVQSGTISVLYWPFWELTSEEVEAKVMAIKHYIQSQNYGRAISLSEELSMLSIRALQYYHNYYQGILLSFTSLSFLGWIAWLFCTLRDYKLNSSLKHIHWAFGGMASSVLLLIQVQSLDWKFNVHLLLPIVLWWRVFCKMDSWKGALDSKGKIIKILGAALILVLFTEVLVASFFQRWILSLGMLACSLWPLWGKEKVQLISPKLLFLWLLSCACLAVFPLLPVIGSESSLALVILSGLLWAVVVIASLFMVYHQLSARRTIFELIPLMAAIFVVFTVTKSIEGGHGLPFIGQFLAWSLLFSPVLICCTFGQDTVPKRLIRLHAIILSPYILMSVRHEGLFILALCFHLNCWLVLEAQLNGVSISQLKRCTFPPPKIGDSYSRSLSIEDFRRAALFVFYIFLSFFGTGNIASLNSFEVTWVRCFLSVFSPFTMMSLILIKMLIPFVIVSSMFRAINITIQAPTGSIFIAVLIFCDLMGLQFLHLVTNEGSWLDIGTSISHFVIVQVTVLALVLLYGIASILTGSSIPKFYLRVVENLP